MSYEDVALADSPVALWRLDGASPFVDLTGRGSAATTSSTAKHASMMKGASSAVLVGNSNKLNVDAPVMKRGKEDQPFTIGVTFRLVRKDDSIAEQQIFGTASAMDGLVIAGTVLSFSTKYSNTGQARCEFDLQEYRAVRVWAVHTRAKNSLYVDGELVAEVTITPEQQADTYLTAGTSLTSGTTSNTNLLALNGLTIYTHALDDSDIDTHFDEITDNMDEFAVGAAYGASVFALNSSTSVPLFEYRYETDEDWMMGRMSGVASEYGQLIPQKTGGVTMGGTWEKVIPLPPDTTLSSLTLNWQGENEIVETSLDGTSWSREKRSGKIVQINDGFTTDGKILLLRVRFPAGLTTETAYFDELVVTGYGPVTTVAPALETRTLTLQNASIEIDADITEYHENWGIELNNGTLSLSGSSETAIAPKTIQIWAKKGTSGSFSDNMQANATNWYTNDGHYQQAYQTDEWQLRTYTFTVGHSDAITITGTGQIGCILVYPYVLTTEQISDTYVSFTGTKSTQFAQEGVVGFVDITSLVEIYEFDWAIEAGG